MAIVIPLRPFENALRQVARAPITLDRQQCVRRVLEEIHAGRSGNAVAAYLQRARLQPSNPHGGAA